MAIEKLTSRAVIGRFYNALQNASEQGWVDPMSMYFNSDQAGEEYYWIGQTPAMREWVGGRLARGFSENGIAIPNLHYEATLDIPVKDMRRDKSRQVMIRISELARRTESHWGSLLATLLLGGATGLCYDGQYFFDTDHAEGDSGAQSNKIDSDISALPAAVHGVVAAPSVEEMRGSIMAGITKISGYLDDVGEPMNEDANGFLVMVPTTLLDVAIRAVSNPLLAVATETALVNPEISIRAAGSVRLNSWTDTFVVARTDAETAPFIRQEEMTVNLKVKAEGSEYEFDVDRHQYGVDTWRNVGYGYWQQACLVTMT
jgi:phage major head subunit gpT-like protein